MSDSVLDAILKLSYFIIQQNNVSDETVFLKRLKYYLQKFNFDFSEEELLKKFHEQKHKLLPNQNNFQQYIAESEVKKLCSKFGAELLTHEKIFITICIIEFTSLNDLYTKKTQNIILQLVSNCNISIKEFQSIREFILEEDNQRLIHLSDLFISNSKENIRDDLEGAWIEKHRPSEMVNVPKISNNKISGSIFFHYQQSLNNILFKFNGDEPLYFNKELVKPGEVYIFKNKDKLLFDQEVVIDYKDLSNTILKQFSKKSVVLTGKSVEYNSKRKVNSLKSFTFSEKSGTLVGLVGGKHSEKHILIKLLAGELFPDNGHITINGYDTRFNNYKTRGLIGYVPSERRLKAGLTIYENYFQTTKLYLRNYSKRKINELIIKILNELGLQNTKSIIWNNQAKESLSDLQVKLICLGFELIKDPSVLILEEIFDGLTPIETQTLIGILREQAMKGKVIIASSTPPLLINLKEFDCIWLMDKGGYPIYNGKPDAVLTYFSELSKSICPERSDESNLELWQIINHNIIDKHGEHTSRRKISPKDWFNHYKENIENKINIHGFRNILPQTRVKLPDLDKQLFIFLKRDLKAFFRQPSLFLTYFIATILAALFTGFFCRHSNTENYSFITNENLSFFYLLNSINALVLGIWIGVGSINREGAFYRLNKLQNLSSISYFSSKISLHVLLLAVLIFFYAIISYAIIDHVPAAIKHSLVYLLLGVAGCTFGYNIAVYTKNTQSIYILTIAILAFQLLFSGQIVPFDKFPQSLNNNKKYVPFIADLSLLKWGHEALMVDQATDNKYSQLIFEDDKVIKSSKLYNEYILPELLKKVNSCFYLQEKTEDEEQFEESLTILKTEIDKMPKFFDVFPFEFTTLLTPEDFNQEIGLECINYINYIQYHLYEKSEGQKTVLKARIDSLKLNDRAYLKEKYFNEAVYSTVTNIAASTENAFFETDKEIVPSIYQVYLSPVSNFGRSHLYAHQKLFNGQYIKTFWFNIIVIWIGVGIAYLFLVTEFIHFFRNWIDKHFVER